MTIQEIKDYINSRLGGVLKCVLPSYWWKKFFGIVLDRMEESEKQTQVQLDKIAIKQDAYKYRRLVADDEDKEGAISNNKKVFDQIWTDFYLGGLMKEVREPLYVLTHPKNGERLLVSVAAKATALIATDGYTYIEAFNVPFGDRVTNIMFKEDGTYYVDYGMQLYYRTDGGDLTAEEISANSDLVNNLSNGGTNGRLDFHQIKCVNVADVGGQIHHLVIGMENVATFYPSFYVMEYDKVVKVNYKSGVNKNDMTTQIIGTIGVSEGGAKIYTIPEGVKNATSSAPYMMSQEEIDDFLAQGDFSNTIVRFANPEMSSVLMYPESISVNSGVLTANFTVSQTASSNGVAIKLGITTYQIQIGVMNGQGMGAFTKTIATINL